MRSSELDRDSISHYTEQGPFKGKTLTAKELRTLKDQNMVFSPTNSLNFNKKLVFPAQ